MRPRIDRALPLMAVAMGTALESAAEGAGQEYLASRLGLLAAMMAVAAEEAARWPQRLRAQNRAMRELLLRQGREAGPEDAADAALAQLSDANEELREEVQRLAAEALQGPDPALLRECLDCLEVLVAEEHLVSAQMLFAGS